jgi:LysM repeat protein
MKTMFLRTRLHMYLLWSTCVFAFLAFISGLLTDGGGGSTKTPAGGDTETSVTTTTVASGPTTTYIPLQYTVQPGESLFAIAQRLDISAPALVELNKIKNPDRVDAGTVLLLPPVTGFVPIGATTTMPP